MQIVQIKKKPMTELGALKHWISIASYDLVSEVDKDRLKICLAHQMAEKEKIRFR